MRNIEKGMYKGQMVAVFDVVEINPQHEHAASAYMRADREWASQQAGILRCGSVVDSERREEVCVYEVEDEHGSREWVKAPNPLIRLMVPVQQENVHQDMEALEK
jgi:hypothetical protein